MNVGSYIYIYIYIYIYVCVCVCLCVCVYVWVSSMILTLARQYKAILPHKE